MFALSGTNPWRAYIFKRCFPRVLGRAVLVLFFFSVVNCYSPRRSKNIIITPKIIGESKIANIEMFEVSLFNQKHPHFCGGAIIAPNWVLTSAHCKGVCENNNLCAVRYATLELRKGQIAPIRLFISHEDYSNDPFLKNDIALAEAPLDVSFDFSIIPILPFDIPFDKDLTLIGWGWTQMKSGSCSKHLRSSDVHRVQCPRGLSKSFFCAFARDSNPCHGDSGGSLVFRGQLIGLVGFALTDTGETGKSLHPETRMKKPLFQTRCKVGETVAFTYVVKFVPWIQETIRNVSIEYESIINEPFKGWSKREMDLLSGLYRKRDEC